MCDTGNQLLDTPSRKPTEEEVEEERQRLEVEMGEKLRQYRDESIIVSGGAGTAKAAGE